VKKALNTKEKTLSSGPRTAKVKEAISTIRDELHVLSQIQQFVMLLKP
jgi:hypothetical protein